jgi:hypothetical protein
MVGIIFENDMAENFLQLLRKNGYGINIDKTHAGEFSESRLIECELQATIKMMSKSHRMDVCLHEAAHAEYYEQAGFLYVGLGSCYMKQFQGGLEFADACIATVEPRARLESMSDLDRVKINIAPQFAGKFIPGEPVGKDSDEEQLKAFFDKRGLTAGERNKLLTDAESKIFDDAVKPHFQDSLVKRAEFFKLILETDLYGVGGCKKHDASS